MTAEIYINAKGSKRFHVPRLPLHSNATTVRAHCGQYMYRPNILTQRTYEEMLERFQPCKIGCFPEVVEDGLAARSL